MVRKFVPIIIYNNGNRIVDNRKAFYRKTDAELQGRVNIREFFHPRYVPANLKIAVKRRRL